MVDHIHTPRDGRGLRDVYVNGNLIDGALWADTRKGIVWFYPSPARIAKGKDYVYARRLRGTVEVVAHG